MKPTDALRYCRDVPIAAADLAALFRASGIRRPVDDLPRLQQMLDRADLVISAWEGERLVGICRALTDFCYCCYVSDLAVHGDWQRRGVGGALLAQLRAALDERVSVLLLSAPEAMAYYPAQGFAAADNAFLIKRQR